MNEHPVLRIGMPLPDVLAKRDGITVVLFFRGPWCPVCRRQIVRIGERKVEWEGLGANIIAVSSCPITDSSEDTPLRQYGIDYQHDPGGAEIVRLGLAMEHPEHGIIARPATLIADATGIIRYAHIGTHTRDRPEPEAILLGVRTLATQSAVPR